MKEIRLYGSLRKKFGREYRLDVATPAEAVRALCAVVPGFRDFVTAPGRAFRVLADGVDQTYEGIHAPCAQIKIIPAVGGAKESWETVLIGAALVSAAFVSGGAALAFLGKGAFGVAAKFAVGSMGFSLMFGGVAAMFARNPEGATVGNVSNEPNRAFDGPVNSVGQGNCVPLAYGRIRAGSVVLSGSVCTERFPFLKNAPDLEGTRGGNGDTTPWTWSLNPQGNEIAFQQSPKSVTVQVGQTATFTALCPPFGDASRGSMDVATWFWEKSQDGGGAWTTVAEISNWNSQTGQFMGPSTTYTTPAVSMEYDQALYRVRANNEFGNRYSSCAVLTVTA